MQVTRTVCEDPVLLERFLIATWKYETDERTESAYVLRRAELHHRVVTDEQSPWSIRQTAVYHKLTAASDLKKSSSTFILIAPSPKLEGQLSQFIELSKLDERAIGPWNVHRLLIADSLSGWMDYMAWLEEGLREQVGMSPTFFLIEKLADGVGDGTVELHSQCQSRR
jgi:hypothetical protein